MISLREILTGYTVDDLQIILKLADTSCSGIKSVVIDKLIKDVYGQNLKKTWDLLLPIEKLAVAEAIYTNHGRILASQIAAKYGQQLLLGPRYFSRYSQDTIPKIALFNFKFQGIPQDLIHQLKMFVPAPEKSKISYLTEASVHNPRMVEKEGVLLTYNAQRTVFHDFLSVLGLIKNDTLKVSPQTQMPTAPLITKLNKILTEPDYYAENGGKSKPVRGFAWIVLLKTAQLIRYQGDMVVLTKVGESFIGKPKAEHIKMIFEAFLERAEFDDIVRIDTISKMRSKYNQAIFTEPTTRRTGIATALKDCTYDKWISLSEFCRYMRAQYPRFQVASVLGDLSVANSVCLEHLDDHYPYLEGTYIKYFLMEILATLGMVEIKYHQAIFDEQGKKSWWDVDFVSTYDGLYEFKITALGAYCLGLTQDVPQIEAVHEKLFHVMPNLEVTSVVGNMLKSDMLFLDSCSDRVNEKTWKLSQTKLLTVVEDKNFFLPEFKDFLYSHAISEIPKTVEHFFDDLKRRTDQVSYVEESKTYFCKDKMLAKLIEKDTKTKPFCRLAGDHYLIVSLKSDKQFKAALKKVGYITKLVS